MVWEHPIHLSAQGELCVCVHEGDVREGERKRGIEGGHGGVYD